jgi:hypothetical protein
MSQQRESYDGEFKKNTIEHMEKKKVKIVIVS